MAVVNDVCGKMKERKELSFFFFFFFFFFCVLVIVNHYSPRRSSELIETDIWVRLETSHTSHSPIPLLKENSKHSVEVKNP